MIFKWIWHLIQSVKCAWSLRKYKNLWEFVKNNSTVFQSYSTFKHGQYMIAAAKEARKNPQASRMRAFALIEQGICTFYPVNRLSSSILKEKQQ